MKNPEGKVVLSFDAYELQKYEPNRLMSLSWE